MAQKERSQLHICIGTSLAFALDHCPYLAQLLEAQILQQFVEIVVRLRGGATPLEDGDAVGERVAATMLIPPPEQNSEPLLVRPLRNVEVSLARVRFPLLQLLTSLEHLRGALGIL